ncbi:autotransporter domain-containing protein [Bosea sp. F3-2]|uniref:autotransporter domain-containing protein n=1 Tax=Bosea sp. F3-2 TaxID=2599640 RepID=UPI001654CD2C|nr:autotransporter domain-containing protein [Bosea sp. F3-2]
MARRARLLKGSTALAGATIAVLTLPAGAAMAQTFTFVGGGGASWSTPGSWDTGVVPNSATAQVLLPDPPVNTGINLSGGTFTVNTLTFAPSSGTRYGIGNGTLRFDGTNATIDVQAATPEIFFLGYGPMAVVAATDLTVNVVAGGSFSIESGATLSGSGALIKTGAGTMFLAGANSHGGTVVEAGLLQTNEVNTLGPGPLTVNGGTLDLNGFNQSVAGLSGTGGAIALGTATLTTSSASSTSYAGVITGSGTLVKGGAGTQTFTGANAYIGGTTINAGTLALSGAGSLAMTGALNLANAGAGFDISAADGNRTIGALAGSAATTVALGAHTLILGDAFNQTFAGVIGGSGGLVKQGAGTLTLDGANTYTGGTTINAGTLALTGGSLAASSAVSLAGAGAAFDMSLGFGDKTIGSLSGVAGSTVALGLNTLTFGNATNQIFAGSIDGTGGLVKQGAGLQTLSGASSYGGATLVSAGELRVDGTLSGLGAMTVNAGATLSGTGGIAGAVTVNGTLSAGHSPGTLTVGALTLNGGSTSIFELNSPGVVGGSDPVAGNDLVEVTGNLTLGGTLDARAAAAGHYRLFDYGGTLAGSFASQGVTSTRSGFTIANAQVETATAGQVNLAVFGTGQTMQFWDGTNTIGNGLVNGGAGTWAPFGTNWTNSTGSANAGWGGSVGVFAGTAGGAVSVAGTISFDTLQFSANGYALSGGTLSIRPASGTAGTFNVDNGVTANIASTIADGGGTAIAKVGNGRLVLSGSNSYSGGTAIEGGVLQISADANLGAASGGLSLNGGTLATTASFASFRPVTLDGPGGFDVAAGTQFELGGAVSGPGSLTKLGAGTLLLSGFNSHGGGTVITAGTLQAGSADALGPGALTLNGGTFKAGTNFINSFANAIVVNAAGGRVDVNGQVMTLSGNITDGSGAGGALAFVNSDTDIGAVDLRGNNSYTGPTSVGAGVTLTALTNTAFSPNSDVTLASTGALMTNGHNTMVRSLSGSGIVVNAHDTLAGSLTVVLPSGTASFAGTILDGEPGDAPLKLVKSGAGTQILTGTNSYTGGTTISAGVLQIGNGGTTGSIIGNVVNNRTLAFNRSDNITFTGTISGSGDVQKLGAGSLTLTGTNSYGGTLIQAGTLIGSATSFGLGPIHNNAALVFDQPGDGTFARAINGTGTLTKRGAGNLNLTGDGNLGGSTTVEAGKLSVNASFANSAVTVLSGAALGGSGTVGSTTIQSGATIAPGNSIGTLNVNGNLTLAPGSTYEAEIAGNGTSDRIAVTGSAIVTGSQVGVTALDPQTSYINGQRYTVLTATGGVSGTAPGAVSRSAFLDLSLDQQPNQVDLVIAVKGTSPVTPSDPAAPPVTPPAPPPSVFQTVAETRNQFATAVALNTLPQAGGTLALYNSLLMLDAPSARVAFDTLSGEIHASAKTALIDESWFMRNAMNDRLRSAFGSVGAAPMATMSYGFTADLAPGVTGPMPALRSDRFAVWGQGYGAWGRTDGNRNAAGLTRSTGGFLLGADAAVFDTLRFGLIAGYSHSEFDVKGRLSSGESDNYHLGLYGGGQWGALGLRVGASYTWHDVETSRTVAFAGFGDRLKGGYDAGTAQVFGELGYRVTLGRVELEPFVGLAYVNLHTAGFSETGGLAALTARGDDTNLGYSTLGLRASTTVAVQGMELSLRGALAWRHAFGDVDPRTTLAFAGSSAFTIAGLPIARDAALAEAGLDLAISRNATLSLSYAGQLATDAQDHSFKGALAVRF